MNEFIKFINNIDDNYLIVGVSAGPDSMALLHMLLTNSKKQLICAHVNHNLRKESKEEESYLKDFCKNNNITFESIKLNKLTGKNLENEARIKRYAFYEKILKKYHSHSLILAHHGDDLIETVIMKILRGSNLEGYAGIKTISKQKDYNIIRPLLYLTKEDLIKYNEDNNIKYYIDETNSDVTYTRNRIRKNILPEIKKEDKNAHTKFLKYSNTLQEYYNYIEDIVTEKINTIYKNNIPIKEFNKEHPFIQKNIIFYILSRLYNNESNIIKDKHIESIIKIIKSSSPNQTINIPKGYQVKKEYDYVYIVKKENYNKDYKIKLDNIVKISNIIIKKVDIIDTDGNDVCRLNSDDIKLPLYLRNKKDGDCISVLGLNGSKKVKEVFIENKMPASIRNNYPLLVDSDDNILWIPNIKKSKYNVKKNGKYDIILTSYKEREEKIINEKEN